MQKLQERKKLFEAGSYKDNDEKAKWRTIMTMDFMSSDQSGVDDGNEVLLSKPLPWESPSVTLFKKTLDDAALQQKSPLAKRQMKPRKRECLQLEANQVLTIPTGHIRSTSRCD